VITFSPGQTRANNAILPLAHSASGFMALNGWAGTVRFVLDANGPRPERKMEAANLPPTGTCRFSKHARQRAVRKGRS